MYEDPADIDYADIRRRVSRRIAMRIAFFTHLLTFALLTPGRFYDPLWNAIATIWFVMLMFHFGLWLYGEVVERAVRKAVERERAWFMQRYSLMEHKRKHDDLAYNDERAAYRIAEDGELTDPEWDEQQPKRKPRSR